MKREIIFRGQRVDNKEWIEGSLVMVNNGETLNRYPCIVFSYNHDTFDWYEVIPETVGQFTGLKDKKGKKIFEGDKVHFDGKPYNVYDLKVDGIIVNHKGSWAIKHQATFTKEIHFCYKLFSSEDFVGKKSEIIGNIHEP